MVEIASARIKQEMLKNFDLKGELKKPGRQHTNQLTRMAELPERMAQILEEYQRGQTRINFDMHASDELARLLHRLVRNIVMGLWVMALLISSSIVCTTDMTPKILWNTGAWCDGICVRMHHSALYDCEAFHIQTMKKSRILKLIRNPAFNYVILFR